MEEKRLVGAFLLLAVIYSTAATQCDRSAYKKIGCYKRQHQLFPHLVVNDRDPTHANYSGLTIDWNDYGSYLHSLACRCSAVTKAIKYKYFAIGFYGECWAGYDTKLFRSAIWDHTQGSIKCINGDYWACAPFSSNECAGGAGEEFVYQLAGDEGGEEEEEEEE